MNTLFSHSHIFRENILPLIGVCLCIYFSYHALLGNRSLVKYYSLEKQIETLSQEKADLDITKENLQKRVEMMRPGSVNKDLLEEQVRQILGYKRADEIIMMSN